MQNKRVLLASRPAGWVTEDNFRIEAAPAPQPKEGEVLVKNLWLSLDPYMRGRMSDAKSYVKGVDIGEVMVGQTVGEVLESRHPGYKPGDKVLTQLGWQLCGAAKGEELAKVREGVPLSYYLGVLGMPGLTAYFGLLDVGRPKPGDTVVVSAASGAVGAVLFAAVATLGVSALPFVMAVMIGASNSFLSPVGYQTNAMIYGPGGYRFLDFLRVGGPLTVLEGGPGPVHDQQTALIAALGRVAGNSVGRQLVVERGSGQPVSAQCPPGPVAHAPSRRRCPGTRLARTPYPCGSPNRLTCDSGSAARERGMVYPKRR